MPHSRHWRLVGHGRRLACGRARVVHWTRQLASGCTWPVLVSWVCVGWKRTRETPALGMQPTRVSFWVLVTAQRAHRGTPVSSQGDGKSPACHLIARPLERDEANAMNKTGRKRLVILPNHQEHCAGTFARRCHREHKPPTGLERFQPGWKGVRRAGARDDHINRIERGARPVNVTDGHLRPRLERDTCLLGEVWINFDRCNFACWAGQLSCESPSDQQCARRKSRSPAALASSSMPCCGMAPSSNRHSGTA